MAKVNPKSHLPIRRADAFRLILLAVSVLVPLIGVAQTRPIGAGALVLDDNLGHTITIETPQPGEPGYAAWIANGPIHWHIPIPPVMDANMGFVLPGPSLLGPAQMLYWDPPTPVGGTGGAQGVWRSASVSTVLSGAGMISGTGTNGRLAGFTGTNSIGNTDLTGDVLTSGNTTTTIANTTATGGHIVSAINASSSSVDATHGGTGQSGYATGDVLYASDAATLTKLPHGAETQVLTITGGVPAWENSGAMIDYTTSSAAAITTSQNNYTLPTTSTYIRLSNTSGGLLTITGIHYPGVTDGRVITLVNVSANAITLTNLDPASASANQFDLPGGLPITLSLKGTATFLYDGSLLHWELLSTN